MYKSIESLPILDDISEKYLIDTLSSGMHNPTRDNLKQSLGDFVDNRNTIKQHCDSDDYCSLTNSSFKASFLNDQDYLILYANRLRGVPQDLEKRKVTGRIIYEKLLRGGPYRKYCAFCSAREATQLDHFFPKESFPRLAIEPWNLVPVCDKCNGNKHNIWSSDPDEQLFHPYFDNHLIGQWLHARVIHASSKEIPAGVEFFVSYSNSSDDNIGKRIVNQYEKLQISERFIPLSANKMTQIGRLLSKKKYQKFSASDRSEFLVEKAEDEFCVNNNEWNYVLLNSLARCDWYCNEGYYYGIDL